MLKAELAKYRQTHEASAVLRGDSGYRAMFTEQGPSAAQEAAATFLDTMSCHLGVSGETSDADSANILSSNVMSSETTTAART